MEPAGNSSIHRINPPLSPIFEPDDEEAQLLAVEEAEYIPSPSTWVEVLMEEGNYEDAARAYQNLPASQEKDSLFKTMKAILSTHPNYCRTLPILLGLVHPIHRPSFMLELAEELIGKKRLAFTSASKELENLVLCARLNCEQLKAEVIRRENEAVDACSNVLSLSELYQIVKARQIEWLKMNKKLLQVSCNFYLEALKEFPQLHEPNDRHHIVTRAFRHPALEQVRELVAEKRRELHASIQRLFQEAIRLQIPAVCGILAEIEAKERLMSTPDSKVQEAELLLQQKRQELGEAYEKVRLVYRLMENCSWKQALEMKMLANLIDMEQRSQFPSWLNRPS